MPQKFFSKYIPKGIDKVATVCYICSMRSNTETKEPTVTRNFRLPQRLLNRITLLAQKRRWSINAWVVNTLERESKPKN